MSNPLPVSPFKRGVAPTEKLYLAGLDVVSPVCLHLFVEGQGNIDEADLRKAIAKAAEFIPGCRLVLQGKGTELSWVEQPTPPPLIVINSPVDVNNFESMPFLREPVDPYNGPTCSVILLPDSRIVFRAFHGVMDGMGMLCWIREVFRALREETPTQFTDSQLDFEVAALEGTRPVRPVVAADAPCAITPLGANVRQFVWKRKRLNQTNRLSAPTLAVTLAKLHRELGEERALRCTVPVDLRSRVPGIANTGNLSLPLFITVSPDSTPEEVTAEMLKQLANGNELAQDPSEVWLDRLPRWLVANLFRLICSLGSRMGRFPASAILSHLGRLDITEFTTASFQAETVWALPVHAGISPLALAIIEHKDHVELCCCAPGDEESQRRTEALFDAVENALAQKLELNKEATQQQEADDKSVTVTSEAPPIEEKKSPESFDTGVMESEIKLLLAEVSLEPDLTDVESDMNFFELGIIDSLGFVKLICMLQSKYDVIIQEDDYASGAFFTLEGIANWISARRS